MSSKPKWDVLDRIMTKYYPQKWKRLKEEHYGKKAEEPSEEKEESKPTRRGAKRRRVRPDNF